MISFNNRFIEELPGDPERQNFVRQVYSACFSFCQPSAIEKNGEKLSLATVLSMNDELAAKLGFDSDFLHSQNFANVFSGQALLEGMQPYAMCYGGHQFGNWAGQLGDGRAINLGELNTSLGYQTVQLKGAGMTPYSRHADGLAVLRSSLREYLCSEAMHYLGVPTTRALSLVLTGEQVERDMFYDGNPQLEPGAVVCRVAPSFIRFGSFEIFATRGDNITLKQLMDFCIQHDFSDSPIASIADEQKRYIAWFQEIVNRSCELVIHWQRIGFVHGVLNTDNMSIIGLTMDYGPYGWLDDFAPNWTPNTTDLPGRRYCFANQPKIVHWNLFQLAQALLLVVDDTKALQAILDAFPEQYQQGYLAMMAQKLGLQSVEQAVVSELETILQEESFDMTLFFRLLAEYETFFGVDHFKEASYISDHKIFLQDSLRFETWLKAYQTLINASELTQSQRMEMMNRVNPCLLYTSPSPRDRG